MAQTDSDHCLRRDPGVTGRRPPAAASVPASSAQSSPLRRAGRDRRRNDSRRAALQPGRAPPRRGHFLRHRTRQQPLLRPGPPYPLPARRANTGRNPLAGNEIAATLRRHRRRGTGGIVRQLHRRRQLRRPRPSRCRRRRWLALRSPPAPLNRKSATGQWP